MAYVPYPAWLPAGERDGYAFRHVSPLIRQTFISGRSMQRRRGGSTPTNVTVSWLLSSQVAALFEKWFQEDLMDGQAWFLCRLKTTLGIDFYRSRFVDIYDGPSLAGVDMWRFTATLELFTRPLLADGSTAYPDPFLHPQIVDLTANKEWPEA